MHQMRGHLLHRAALYLFGSLVRDSVGQLVKLILHGLASDTSSGSLKVLQAAI